MEDKQYKDIVGLLVHSYNNYLSGMMGFTELAVLETSEENVAEKLNFSLDSGRDAVLFGKQLLSSIARLQVPMVPSSLQVLVKGASESFGNIELVESKDSIMIATDADWFSYCLNATFQFLDDKFNDKLFSISMQEDDKNIKLWIHHDQVELSEEDSQSLFEPFYSSRVMLGKKEVGLAFVHGFTRQMKGYLKWKNREGFEFTFSKPHP